QIEGEEASAYEALVLGTRDYVRKCGFQRVIIGLSGGIDSALTATIAVDALGSENVIGIGMPGPYSSPGSIDDARQLATNLGIRFRRSQNVGVSPERLREFTARGDSTIHDRQTPICGTAGGSKRF